MKKYEVWQGDSSPVWGLYSIFFFKIPNGQQPFIHLSLQKAMQKILVIH